MLDIFNKIQTIYNWSSNTDTKTNQIYTWFSNIYNELNSTSTSYMKGKINSIYSWSSSMNSKVNNIHSEVTSSSSSSISGQLQSIYDKIVSSGSGGVVRSVQYGTYSLNRTHGSMYIHSYSVNDLNKTIVLINIQGYYSFDNYDNAANGWVYGLGYSASCHIERRDYDEIHVKYSAGDYISWQIIEFY